MTAPTPAATARLLLDAADRLEELAGAAPPAPWHVVEDHGRDFTGEGYSAITITSGPQAVTSRGPRTVAVMADPGVGDGGDVLGSAFWIAAMSPAVAAPLAAWLREEAAEVREHLRPPGDPEHRRITVERLFAPALEFARTVLGVYAPPEGEGSGGAERPSEAPRSAETGALGVQEGSEGVRSPLSAAGGDDR